MEALLPRRSSLVIGDPRPNSLRSVHGRLDPCLFRFGSDQSQRLRFAVPAEVGLGELDSWVGVDLALAYRYRCSLSRALYAPIFVSSRVPLQCKPSLSLRSSIAVDARLISLHPWLRVGRHKPCSYLPLCSSIAIHAPSCSMRPRDTFSVTHDPSARAPSLAAPGSCEVRRVVRTTELHCQLSATYALSKTTPPVKIPRRF